MKDTTQNLSLLSVSDVANRLHVHQNMIYKMIWNKTLPSVRIGRAVRVDPRDLEAFITRSRESHNC
jgi:excisionase family DNA binding protein